jgi:hypothetical protein
MFWPPIYDTDPGNIWLRNLLLECAAELGVEQVQKPIH